MKALCKKAGGRYFRFHPALHQGACILDRANVNIGSIQRIFGHANGGATEICLYFIREAERDNMRTFGKMPENSHKDSLTKKELAQMANLLH